MFAVVTELSATETDLLDATKINKLLSEKNSVAERYEQVCKALKDAGISN